MRLVATAGHVDHGKSTLVRALTGTDPDRWEEEKRRGLTIDLGFAQVALPSGDEIEFIDVPGHVRFVRNMIAGVGSVRLCLFVVAANEGWKPQSEEHLRILELAGVTNGVVALTKAGLCDSDMLAAAQAALAERLRGTFLAEAEVVTCDAVTGQGLHDLTAALARLPEVDPMAKAEGRPRLWVDRAFSMRGSGTVVTGTLTGGPVAVDDALDVLPIERRVRLRGLQSHGRALGAVEPGGRTAMNLVGISHSEVARGHAIVRADQWAPTTVFDASLRVLAAIDHPVTRRGAYLAYIGSGEHVVRLRLLGRDSSLDPGSEGFARLHLGVALPLLPGDRFVLRDAGRGETVGGGEVLDVAPVLPAAQATPDRSVERVVRERGWVVVDELERLTGARVEPTVGHWVVSPDALNEARDHVFRSADDAVAVNTIDERHRALAQSMEELSIVDGLLTRAGADGGRLDQRDQPYLRALAASPFAPPSPTEAGSTPEEIRALVRQGLIVERNGIYFSSDAVAEAARRVAALLASSPEGFTAARAREALGTSRKYAIPLLEHLDATGVTRRRGDLRVAGPRLPKTNSG